MRYLLPPSLRQTTRWGRLPAVPHATRSAHSKPETFSLGNRALAYRDVKKKAALSLLSCLKRAALSLGTHFYAPGNPGTHHIRCSENQLSFRYRMPCVSTHPRTFGELSTPNIQKKSSPGAAQRILFCNALTRKHPLGARSGFCKTAYILKVGWGRNTSLDQEWTSGIRESLLTGMLHLRGTARPYQPHPQGRRCSTR